MMQRAWEKAEREKLRKALKGHYPTIQQVRATFKRFDRLYFRGTLAAEWQVQYAGAWPWDRLDRPARGEALEFRPGSCLMGRTDPPSKTIYIRRGLAAEDMAVTVLHEMIHATGVLGHDVAFRAELHRIADLGEPLAAREAAALDATGGRQETLT